MNEKQLFTNSYNLQTDCKEYANERLRYYLNNIILPLTSDLKMRDSIKKVMTRNLELTSEYRLRNIDIFVCYEKNFDNTNATGLYISFNATRANYKAYIDLKTMKHIRKPRNVEPRFAFTFNDEKLTSLSEILKRWNAWSNEEVTRC